ncbi:hypothetical protein [Corynebacterium macginleyi]
MPHQADVLALHYATDLFDVAFSAFGAFPFLTDCDTALAWITIFMCRTCN